MRKHGSRRTGRGQVTIPRDLHEQLRLEPGDEVRFTSAPAGLQIEKAPRQSVFDRYRGCLPHLRGEDAVEPIRNRRGRVR
jgi:bifunctional DNA-binding transcriptional regulator/antitoxin component of YhaV-PrlF toxin-antitoxin module